MVMLVKTVQLENALLRILVTLVGMVTPVKPLQTENAASPIVATLAGMENVPDFPQGN